MTINKNLRVGHPISALRDFLEKETAGGLILMGAAALALLVANSPLSALYFGVLHAYVAGLSVEHWINDGLMAVFFLLVGLEIKREMLNGQLSTWSRCILPGAAALGGMVIPALIYIAFNVDNPEAVKGWAIPTATDIAFALGVLSLFGSRVPASLKVFLTALAIIDDLGAVVIIALFYTDGLSIPALGLAALILACLICLNRAGTERLWPYLVFGAILWFAVLQSGVHATLAGVALALTVPLRPTPRRTDNSQSPLHRLEHGIHAWVAFLVVPVFGFASAGVSFAGVDATAVIGPVPLGIAMGLFVGKQVGVFGTTWATVRLGLAEMPAGSTIGQLYAVALLCGIGFTMSLFIGSLAFAGAPELSDAVKIGVLGGSILSGIAGWLVFCFLPDRRVPKAVEEAPSSSDLPGR